MSKLAPKIEEADYEGCKTPNRRWNAKRELDRLMERKLSFIDPIVLASRRNKDGMTARMFLEEALQQHQQQGYGGKRKYFNAEFWEQFFEDFEFKSSCFPGLREVSIEAITLDDEYWEVMELCNHYNPTLRSEEQWCQYVRRLGRASEDDLIGLFHASMRSQAITQRMSYNMLLALGCLCGRLHVPDRYPEVWGHVSATIDSILKWHWEQKQSKDSFVDRDVWVATHSDAVFAILVRKDFDALVQATASQMPCPEGPLASVMQSALGLSLFRAEGKIFQLHAFIQTCEDRARDLIHNGFPEEDIVAYHENAASQIKILAAAGHDVLFRRGPKRLMLFLNERVEVYPTSLHDIKDWILEGTARSLAISNGQLNRFPWELVLFEDAPLPNFGRTEKVPESLLVQARNGRKVMAAIAGDWGPGRTLLFTFKETFDGFSIISLECGMRSLWKQVVESTTCSSSKAKRKLWRQLAKFANCTEA